VLLPGAENRRGEYDGVGFEAKKGYLSGVSLFDLLNIYFIFSLADTVLELSN